MKLVKTLLLTLLLATSSSASPDASGEDQLCRLCAAEAMPQAKLDMVLLDRMIIADEKDETSTTTTVPTCADFEFFEIKEGAGESCAELQEKYAHACCSPDFDEFPELQLDMESAAAAEEPAEEPTYLRGHRDLAWTVSGSNQIIGRSTTQTGHNQGAVPLQSTGSGNSGSEWCRDNRYASNSERFATPGGACKCPVCSDGRTPTPAMGGSFFVPGGGRYSGKTCEEMNDIGIAGQLTNGFCVPFQRANAVCCEASQLGWSIQGNGRE